MQNDDVFIVILRISTAKSRKYRKKLSKTAADPGRKLRNRNWVKYESFGEVSLISLKNTLRTAVSALNNDVPEESVKGCMTVPEVAVTSRIRPFRHSFGFPRREGSTNLYAWPPCTFWPGKLVDKK